MLCRALLVVASASALVRSTVRMGLPTLHGSQGSRSPLVNWFCEERSVKYAMAPPKPSNHPFGQVPFLVDGDVEVFESGAILLYLADAYDPAGATPAARAAYTKWVVWANSALDPVCFDENERGQVIGTRLDRPDGRLVATLERILGESDYLVDDAFSVADVAVAAYLNYVPVFFNGVNLNGTPNIMAYMRRCAERPAFATAFGDGHAAAVLAATAPGGAAAPGKLFGVF
jgi:glutathione S-transferase/alpha,alpha-trehalase